MRWIRNLFALLATACAVVWITSEFRYMGAGAPLRQPDSQLEIGVFQGRITIASWNGTLRNLPSGWYIDVHYVDMDAVRFNNEFFRETGMDLPMPDDLPSFEYKPYRSYADPAGKWTWGISSIAFPLWLPTLLFGLWPGISLTRRVKRRYFTRGICRGCGYDLRGTPSGVCPECGHGASATTR